MGCAVTSLRKSGCEDEDDDGVRLCRERKRLMKMSVDRRYAVAGAHFKYNQSMYAVALAIRLFVARHSSSTSSPLLITLPAPSPDNPVHPRRTHPKPTAAIQEEEQEEEDGPICEHFYDDTQVGPASEKKMTSSSQQQQSQNYFGGGGGWDYFFNPFDNLMVNGGVNVGWEAGGGHGQGKSPAADHGDGNGGSGGGGGKNLLADAAPPPPPPPMDNNNNKGRELLEALKEVEDHFLRAHEHGLEFSKMLEFSNVGPPNHLDYDFHELKGGSDKFIPTITWHKSSLTGSPSCRSLLSRSSSRSSSTWTGITSADLFDDNGGMESGSHLSTLGRLYAWEKKLYDEVKAGNEMKKIYDRKCSQLSNENASNKGDIEDEVNDLCSSILVSTKISDSISKRIEKVRDEELQPQLVELLQGLMKTWKTMLESHKIQSRTMFEVKSFGSPALSNDGSYHLATLQLEAEIQNWCSCFSNYISATTLYIEALSEWANRVIAPQSELNDPPMVFTICRDWLTAMKSLPDKAVTYAMKRFAKDIRTLWAQQGIEQQQKRKVNRLVAELRKKNVAFEKEEQRILGSKLSRKNTEDDVKSKVDSLAEKKAQLDGFKNRLEAEKAKHQEYVQETHRVILVGFQTGFSSVFDSLTEFSEICLRRYNEVAESAKIAGLGNEAKALKLNPVLDGKYQK